ncbi:MAG: glycosyltransferase family 2 protein [Pirellulaceae bacterium]
MNAIKEKERRYARAFQHAQGDVVVIQDADSEYDPHDFLHLLRPILEDKTDIVYGSRFSSNDRPVARYWHQTGNRAITLLSNMFTNLKLSDVETCYKMMRAKR